MNKLAELIIEILSQTNSPMLIDELLSILYQNGVVLTKMDIFDIMRKQPNRFRCPITVQRKSETPIDSSSYIELVKEKSTLLPPSQVNNTISNTHMGIVKMPTPEN